MQDRARLWGDVGDFQGLLGRVFAQFNYFVCQTEVGICVKDKKRSLLSSFNRWRESGLLRIVSLQYPMIAGSGTYIGNMVGPESNKEA